MKHDILHMVGINLDKNNFLMLTIHIDKFEDHMRQDPCCVFCRKLVEECMVEVQQNLLANTPTMLMVNIGYRISYPMCEVLDTGHVSIKLLMLSSCI